MQNLNLLFYKIFYSKLGADKKTFDEDVEKKGKILTSSKFYKEDYHSFDEDIAPQKLWFRTVYPGLLVGTGYAHGVESEADIKVGFSFDFVTGQPYIPASSVKGLLRSYFDHPDVIRAFLEEELTDKVVRALMLDIFEENERSADKTDIFFDAVIRCGDKKGCVLGFDSITPHGKDLTKSPNPIKIIKVLPDVVFEFSFNIKDSIIETENGSQTISKESKLKLFNNILINFGIGAKTNVGYGILEEVKEDELKDYSYPDRAATVVSRPSPSFARRDTFAAPSGQIDFEAGKVYEAVVRGGNERRIFIRIDGKACKCFLSRNYVKDELKDNDKVNVTHLYADDYGNHCFKYLGKVR